MFKNRWTRHDRRRRIMVDAVSDKIVELKAARFSVRGWLKTVPNDPSGREIEKRLVKKLKSYPRDCYAVRVENRCVVGGVASSVMRKFRRSRFAIRDMALAGRLTGYRKASW